jgi:hypothetical protein
MSHEYVSSVPNLFFEPFILNVDLFQPLLLVTNHYFYFLWAAPLGTWRALQNG